MNQWFLLRLCISAFQFTIYNLNGKGFHPNLTLIKFYTCLFEVLLISSSSCSLKTSETTLLVTITFGDWKGHVTPYRWKVCQYHSFITWKIIVTLSRWTINNYFMAFLLSYCPQLPQFLDISWFFQFI